MFNTVFDAWSSLAFPWNDIPVQPTARSRFTYGSHEEGGRALRYRLFIPHGEHDQPMPLVVMLHGCGQDAADFAAGTGMNALAEEHACMVLYPEQPCSAHWNRCWNWYDRTHHRRGAGEPALLAGLTRRIMAEHAVDPARVAVAGLSAGGAMAVILGCTYPDLFSAVGCHSGLAHGSASCDPWRCRRHGPSSERQRCGTPVARQPCAAQAGCGCRRRHGGRNRPCRRACVHPPCASRSQGWRAGRAMDRARRRPRLVGWRPARQSC